MIVRYPDRFAPFRCVASACPFSCCIGWKVEIDAESLERYRSLPGPYGAVVRSRIEGGAFALEGRRCAFLTEDRLCDLQLHLGPEALCVTCATFPRVGDVAGNDAWFTLDLACPEACRLAFADSRPIAIVSREEPGEAELPEAEKESSAAFLARRDALLAGGMAQVSRCLDERTAASVASFLRGLDAASLSGFLDPADAGEAVTSFWNAHRPFLLPRLLTLARLLVLSWSGFCLHGLSWDALERGLESALRIHLLLVKREGATVDGFCAAAVLFARRVEHAGHLVRLFASS